MAMRTYILATVIVLFGYTANAASIPLPEHSENGEEVEAYGELIHPTLKAAVAL